MASYGVDSRTAAGGGVNFNLDEYLDLYVASSPDPSDFYSSSLKVLYVICIAKQDCPGGRLAPSPSDANAFQSPSLSMLSKQSFAAASHSLHSAHLNFKVLFC